MRVRARKILGKILQQVVYGEAAEGETQAHHLLAWVVRDTTTDLKAGKVKNAEDRRIRWTNYRNIAQWFENWENDLIELGLADRDPTTGKVMIPEEQLRNMINLDETNCSLDGSTQNKGGRPEGILSDPRFPMVGRMTSKSSLSTTLICGSNAAGEALPPHIQFATKAQSKETMRLDIDSFDHIPDVRGRWGLLQEENKNVTFGMNEKGGMDEKEFEEYILTAIVPLFPNARYRMG